MMNRFFLKDFKSHDEEMARVSDCRPLYNFATGGPGLEVRSPGFAVLLSAPPGQTRGAFRASHDW